MKESFKHFLPSEIISHKKQGFAIPLRIWFKDNLKKNAFDTLLKNTKFETYLDLNYVEKIIHNHQKGMGDYNEKKWSLLFLNEWFKKIKF